ncbi:hypothetical protein F0U60_37030 [Archangium minus]|uniref:Lipoprotein n=1 Tax=Archangium minus TaxID=83450 RepID=A0ABY9X120_9BACT|nr:hypothetical protein F0U61_36865 [Archangium violaceum]WNG49100.1 hypothetical protein F0U60_37030 [Archangium minus]
MKKALTIALFGMAVAVGGVLGATTGAQETTAMPCCSTCEENYMSCLNECGGDATCANACDAPYYKCSRYCSFSC